jgi:hypothetical protein
MKSETHNFSFVTYSCLALLQSLSNVNVYLKYGHQCLSSFTLTISNYQNSSQVLVQFQALDIKLYFNMEIWGVHIYTHTHYKI